MPNVRETTDVTAGTTTVYTLGIGQTAQGTLATAADHDWYRVNLVAGQTYTFAMIGTGAVNDVDDTYLQLRNGAGSLLRADDDSGPDISSMLTFTATTSGTYYLDAGSYNNTDAGQYGISAALGTRAVFDEMMGAGALLVPSVSWGNTPGTAATVTWAARASFAGSVDASGYAAPFSQLTASEIASVQTAMRYYSDAGNISFTQVNPGGYSNNATILISNYTSSTDGSGAYALYPGNAAVAAAHGDMRLNTTSVNTSSQPIGSYSFFTIMHEMGHALGLAHPGDYNADPNIDITYANSAQFRQDSHQYTVMSYFDESSTTSSYNSYPDTLMLYDILAIQQLYGANMTTRTGNTVYGFSSNAGSVYDFAINTNPVMSIWDAAGVDTINASGYSQAQRIDLNAGAFSNIGGFTGNVSIAFGAVIENATGGSGADTLIGNAAANLLNGMGGADTMQGGAGNDTYVVDLATDKVVEIANGGTDVVLTSVTYALQAGSQVETLLTTNAALTTALNLTGNEFAQTLIGNAGANVLNGGAGADTMSGGLGNDSYLVDDASDKVIETAGGGTDRVSTTVTYALLVGSQVEILQFANATLTTALNLTGNEFAQTIIGNAGANTLNGLAGADIMQGELGNDTYIVDNAADRVVEAAGGGTDRILTSISYALTAGSQVETLQFANTALTTALNLIGNEFAQTLIGNAGANTINGLGGADIMQGGLGNDTYVVDNAADKVIEAAGGGSDRVLTSVSFALATGAQIEFLQTTNSALTTALNLTGNEFAQTLIGNAGVNILNGGAGSDIIQGGAGADFFVFNTALGANNVDTLSDFTSADTIRLENAIFTGLVGTGALAAAQFVANTTGVAANANQHIIYETDTGNLYYDSNGSAAGGSVLFAHLNTGLSLTSADFFII